MTASATVRQPADLDAFGADLDLDALIAGSHLNSLDIDVDALLAGSHLATLDASVRTALEGMDLDISVDDLVALGHMGGRGFEDALAA